MAITWRLSQVTKGVWESACGGYRIVPSQGAIDNNYRAILIRLTEDTGWTWAKRFHTVDEAKLFVEGPPLTPVVIEPKGEQQP